MANRRVPYNDADYLDKLSPGDKAYYQQFIAEHYFGRQPKDRKKAILSKKTQQLAWREQYRSRQDVHWTAVNDDFELTTHPENLIIRILDTFKSPLVYETAFGVLMEEKQKKELEFALDMISTALETVGDYRASIKENTKRIQCFNWLLHAKADLEKQLSQTE
jgi:hypothetical protein